MQRPLNFFRPADSTHADIGNPYPVAGVALDLQGETAFQRRQGAVGVIDGEGPGDLQPGNLRIALHNPAAVARQVGQQFPLGAGRWR